MSPRSKGHDVVLFEGKEQESVGARLWAAILGRKIFATTPGVSLEARKLPRLGVKIQLGVPTPRGPPEAGRRDRRDRRQDIRPASGFMELPIPGLRA